VGSRGRVARHLRSVRAPPAHRARFAEVRPTRARLLGCAGPAPHDRAVRRIPVQLSAFASALRTPDLRKKILFTLGIIALFRLGSVTPTPGVDYSAVQTCVASVEGNSLYGLINLFSGGALLQLSIFALGIMPYITASIILQLMTVVIPRLEALKKEGQAGQAQITQYTRYLTVALAILQSTGIVALARTPGNLFQGCNADLIPNDTIMTILVMVSTMTAGTAVIMWLAELITDRGVGNGDLAVALTVTVDAASQAARTKIEAAGGSVTTA
jgi:preprotein translocase subunit SecY